MAIPNGAGGYQVGAGNRAETVMGAMAAPQTATATATLTAAQIVNAMLVANPSTSAATYTLPTGTAITTSQLFRFRKTGDGTYVVYRLG
jgi:hypothetical protein